ncbi:MAG: carboxypeptidase-like regulatory domain-containing protein, partial [Phycisphaeraceae bacterium]
MIGSNVHTGVLLSTVITIGGLISHVSAGSVSGMVQADGAPVSNARVTLYVPSLSVFVETRTGVDGSFAFDNVPNGRKRLGVAAVGYDYQEVLIDVSDFPWVRNFALEPESQIGSWDIIGNTLPELLDATDIGILLADGTIFYCHDTVDPIRFDPLTGEKTF